MTSLSPKPNTITKIDDLSTETKILTFEYGGKQTFSPLQMVRVIQKVFLEWMLKGPTTRSIPSFSSLQTLSAKVLQFH